MRPLKKIMITLCASWVVTIAITIKMPFTIQTLPLEQNSPYRLHHWNNIHHSYSTIHHIETPPLEEHSPYRPTIGTTFTIHTLPFTIHNPPFTIHHIETPPLEEHSPYRLTIGTTFTIHTLPFTIHNTPFTIHHMKSSFPKGVRSIFHENEVMNVSALGTNKSNKKVQ